MQDDQRSNPDSTSDSEFGPELRPSLESRELPLSSERLRRRRAVEAADRHESQLVRAALDNFVDEVPTTAHSLADLRAPLLDQREEMLAAVDEDRATFRKAFIDAEEARSRTRNAMTRALVPVSAASLVTYVVITLFAFDVVSTRDSVKTAAIIIGSAFVIRQLVLRGQPARLASAWRTSSAARREALAAEELFISALRGTAFPEALRRLRSKRVRAARVRPAPHAEGRTEPVHDAVRESDRLDTLDPEYLVDSHRAGSPVDTDALISVRRLVASLAGASIGIAGPRGVGKSTVSRALVEGFKAEGALTALASAPVRYDPRDFLLTTFAQLCEEVQGARSVVRSLTWRQRAVAAGMILFATGVAVYFWAGHVRGAPEHVLGVVLGSIGCATSVIALVRSPRLGAMPFAHRLTNVELRTSDPAEVAAQLLSEIRFQLTFTTGYAGKLTASAVELSGSRSTALAAKQESYPDVVNRFRAFLESASLKYGKVIIALDELDKLPTEDAVRFLDDIKGLFGIERCFFILSVSEDALGLFERRGIPARDAFDSGLDDVIRVRSFDLIESTNLVDSRTTGMPTPLIAWCHALAGGLPRDVIRNARFVALASQDSDSVRDTANSLVTADFGRKLRSTQAAAFDADKGAAFGAVHAWLAQLHGDVIHPDHLLVACARVPRPRSRTPNSAVDACDDVAAILSQLVLAISASAYLAATMLESVAHDHRDLGSLQTVANDLAIARSALSTSALASWQLVDAVRDRLGLPLVSVPGKAKSRSRRAEP
jgi:Cdc6-like AAA superfamily ATPase